MPLPVRTEHSPAIHGLRARSIRYGIVTCALLLLGAVPHVVEAQPRDAEEEDCNEDIPQAVLAAVLGPSAKFPTTTKRTARVSDPAEARPTAWKPNPGGRNCHRYRGARVCEGPRKVALGTRSASAVATRLGLGSHEAAARLLDDPPKPEWVDAVMGDEPGDLAWPVEGGKLWRGFGMVRKGRARRRNHDGIDIGAPEGSPIHAVADGLVVYSDNGVHGYGNLIVLVHKDGSVTFYAHCRANYVAPGEQVERNQVIGEVGQTGLARGAHVHFELHRNGRPRDPLPHLEEPERVDAVAQSSSDVEDEQPDL